MSGYPIAMVQEAQRRAAVYVNRARKCHACDCLEVWAEYVWDTEHACPVSVPSCDEHAPRVRVLCARFRAMHGLPPADTPLSRWRGLYARHSRGSRRYVSGLLRLLAAVEHLPRWDHTDAVMHGIRHHDESAGFTGAVRFAKLLFREAYLPPASLPVLADQEPDPRPGCYYVSAMLRGDAERGLLVAGPYPTHAEALSLVGRVRDHATRLDRTGEAHWAAWGTARTRDPAHTVLGPWRGSQAQPEASDEPVLCPTRA